jgi:hypothetical protein
MPAKLHTILTNGQLEQFDSEGYLKFDPEIPAKVLDSVVSDLADVYSFQEHDTHFDELGVQYVSGPNPRVTNAWKISEALQSVTLAPKVLAVLEELYGRRPKPFQTLNFMTGTEQAAHVDGMYFNSEPPGWMCGVWLALEDIDMDNGPLIYYPGSHELPLPTWEDLGGEPDRSQFESEDLLVTERVRRYRDYVASQIDRYGREPEYGTIKKGQALIWAAHLIHGGSPQCDKSRTRHSQVTHYYFEGDDLRHSWPLEKEGDRTFFNYPAWISWDAPKLVTPDVVRQTVEAHLPSDAETLVATGGWDDMLELGNRRTQPFPPAEGRFRPAHKISGRDAVEQLEELRARGARYLVLPGPQASQLATPHFAEFQAHLEDRYRTVVRDGGTCVIFALE